MDRLRAKTLLMAAACLLPAAILRAQSFETRLEAGLSALKTGTRINGKKPADAAPEVFSFDANVPADVKAGMLRNLALLGAIRSPKQSRLHQEVFGAMDGPTYLRWLGERIKAVGYDPDDDRPGVAGYAPTSSGRIYFTRNFIRLDMPQIIRISFLVHEARHKEAEHGHWLHVECPTPFLDGEGRPIRARISQVLLEGKPACDVTPLGAYGVDVIFLGNVWRNCPAGACTDKTRLDAELFAKDELQRIIDLEAKDRLRKDIPLCRNPS